MKLALVFLLIFFSVSLFAQQENVFLTQSINDYISTTKKRVFDTDNENLFRSIIDLNNDGLNDLLISGYQSGEWGNAGGNWSIYFQKSDGFFEKCDKEIFLHPLAPYFDAIESKLIIYQRLGSSEGVLAFYKFDKYELKFIKSKKISNNSGDNQSKEIDLIISKNPRLKKIKFEQSKFQKIHKLEWE